LSSVKNNDISELFFHEMLKIDTHTHILPKKLPNWSEKFGYGDFIYLQHHKKGAAPIGQNPWIAWTSHDT
jgi:hypothetical protein